jgi:hypothetical protein
MEFHIVQLNRVFVRGLSSIEIELLRDHSGKLMWHNLEMKMAVPTSPSDQEKQAEEKECTYLPLLCKWKALLSDKLAGLKASLKSCHGKMRPHAGEKPHHSHHKDKGHGHGRHGHHRHGRLAAFLHKFNRIAAHVLIPVFIGIMAGLTASAIGIIFGNLIVLLWRSFHHSQRGYSRVEVDEAVDVVDIIDEKQRLMDGEPPEYIAENEEAKQ